MSTLSINSARSYAQEIPQKIKNATDYVIERVSSCARGIFENMKTGYANFKQGCRVAYNILSNLDSRTITHLTGSALTTVAAAASIAGIFMSNGPLIWTALALQVLGLSMMNS